MRYTLTIQVDEANRKTWEVDSEQVASAQPEGKGSRVTLLDGTTQVVLESPEDLRLQREAGDAPQ